MITENTDLRETAKAAGIPYWKIADQLGCHESTLIRHLRHPLSDDERERILAAIEEIKSK